jgi:DNA-binding transcriptional MerR regulator
MAPDRPPRPETGTIAGVLANLRRAPKRVRRQSREVIENAVSQLFDAAVRHPHGAPGSGEYRIDDLARLAGTTTRNIRVYRDRGLLPPPLRVGRIALFNDTHLTRLRLITSMLDRGYNIAHVREMLSAWEEGKNLGDVLGLETAIAGPWTTEKSETVPLDEARRLINDTKAFDRLVRLQVIRVDGAQATVTRPKLIEAFNEIRSYGMSMEKLVDLHEQIVPLIDQISEMLVRRTRRRPDQTARSPARRHRNRRTDHDAGPVSHPGRRVRHRHPRVVDRIDHRVIGQQHPRRLSGALSGRRSRLARWAARNEVWRQRGQFLARLLEFAVGI